MTTPPQPPFWADDFDMDLPQIVPDWLELLGDTAEVTLKTHSRGTEDRINLPSAWSHLKYRSVAFFGREHPHKPELYWTEAPVIDCTFGEVMRDVWSHHYMAFVEGRPVVEGSWLRFDYIMSHRRGWTRLPDRVIAQHEAWARRWVRKGALALRSALWIADNPASVEVVERIR